MIYLDTAASTCVSNGVKQKLLSILDIYGNPSSQHEMGLMARNIILESKTIISNKLNCKISELHFTSGATMSNNLIIRGFFKNNPNGILITDRLEHADILLLADEYSDNSYFIDNDSKGFVDIDNLSELLSATQNVPTLVSIQMANSEIGTIQKIADIVQLVERYPNVYLHMDATQYIPWYPLDLNKLKIDAISMSGQKINCIKGTGLLYLREGTPIGRIILGEQGFIGGTENVIGIGCLGEAFNELNIAKSIECVAKRDYLIKLLHYPINGDKKLRLPNNINMQFKNIDSDEFVELLSENGLYCSAGSACSSYTKQPSHVLKAIGLSDNVANSSIRITIDETITYEDLDRVAMIVDSCYRLMKK